VTGALLAGAGFALGLLAVAAGLAWPTRWRSSPASSPCP
jgi:hypothetical protein